MGRRITIHATAETDRDARALIGALVADNVGPSIPRDLTGFEYVFNGLTVDLETSELVDRLATLLAETCMIGRTLIHIIEARTDISAATVMTVLDEVAAARIEPMN